MNKRFTAENIERYDILAFHPFGENPETDLEQCFQGHNVFFDVSTAVSRIKLPDFFKIEVFMISNSNANKPHMK